jgi:hypothetical protein
MVVYISCVPILGTRLVIKLYVHCEGRRLTQHVPHQQTKLHGIIFQKAITLSVCKIWTKTPDNLTFSTAHITRFTN